MKVNESPPNHEPPTATEIVVGLLIFGGALLWNWWPG